MSVRERFDCVVGLTELFGVFVEVLRCERARERERDRERESDRELYSRRIIVYNLEYVIAFIKLFSFVLCFSILSLSVVLCIGTARFQLCYMLRVKRIMLWLYIGNKSNKNKSCLIMINIIIVLEI